MNVLKGLTDESLQAEVARPSGETPPYLVLSEINRRKDMRQRYAADQARRAPQTTVAQDIAGTPVASMPGSPPPGAPVAPTPAGIEAAMPGPVQGYASGGIVDAVNYNDIASKYESGLGDLDAERKRAAALALISAGAGIMGAGHSNTLQNIGIGINAGVNSYGDALKTTDSRETDLLRGLTDVGQAEHADALAAIDQNYRDRALAQEKTIADDRLNYDKTPAKILEAQAFEKMTPDEQANYLKLNPAYNPNQLNQDQLIGAKLDSIYQDAQKKYPVKDYDTPEDAAAKQQKAQAEAYARIKAAYGAVAANDWAAGLGINPNDLLVGGGAGAPVLNDKDPLGLGL